MRALIIGLGLAGKRHLEAQKALGNETGFFTKTPQVVKDSICFKNLTKAIQWADIVHVCTPDDLHAKFVAEALKNRKAVLCEKPLTTNLIQALELQQLTHTYKTPLIVGHNYRLTPSFLQSKKAVCEGKLGKITNIETTYLHDMTSYRLGTKARNAQEFLYVGGSHAIDLLCWIANEPITRVYAAVGKKIRTEYTSLERYQIIAEFASGLLGHVRLDASSPRKYYGTDLIIEGEHGQMKSHNKQGMRNNHTQTIALEVKIADDYVLGKTASHWPLPDVDEAVYTIKILDTIAKAAETHTIHKIQ